MKKNIIFGITLMVLSLQQLAAQDGAQVSPSISKRFEEAFEGARNVHWNSLPKKVTQAQFYYNGGSWLAYFDEGGNIITSGRRIKSVDELPLKVQEGFDRARKRVEKKGGNAQLVLIYEMLNEGTTNYFVTLKNQTALSTFSISQDGIPVLKLQKQNAIINETPKDAIAKKN